MWNAVNVIELIENRHKKVIQRWTHTSSRASSDCTEEKSKLLKEGELERVGRWEKKSSKECQFHILH